MSRGVNLKERDGNDDNDKENVGSDNAVTSSAGVTAITTATTSEEQQQQPITSFFVSTKRRIGKGGSRNSTSASVDTIDDSFGNEETNSKKINVHVVKEKQSNMWIYDMNQKFSALKQSELKLIFDKNEKIIKLPQDVKGGDIYSLLLNESTTNDWRADGFQWIHGGQDYLKKLKKPVYFKYYFRAKEINSDENDSNEIITTTTTDDGKYF
ncbi:unnamed protein product [Didymodactylos carnosus]|uniref:Uncharacterized protein n=1 Tax=Didymodactylos carnosus TaxID=1234261 RepID=A0A815W9K8_9BILA|nr:unnamed protein product [Didymodactylos carnosus]CAF4400716.1 unnamed protein product [Didymodactylos carnosus]